MIRATGTLKHPASGTRGHRGRRSSIACRPGSGSAVLDVPGIRFGEGLQPEELTRLTEGVIALVTGDAAAGRGGSTGPGAARSRRPASSTSSTPTSRRSFGPVTGLNTTVRFTDLLGLETAPGQIATVEIDQPRHPRREWRDPLFAAARPAGARRARRMAVHGRAPDPPGDDPQLQPPDRQAADLRSRRARRQDLRRHDGVQGNRRDRRVRRRAADDLRRWRRADRRRAPRQPSGRRHAGLQRRGQQGEHRHGQQARVRRAARPPVQVDDHPPRRLSSTANSRPG